MSNNNLSSAVKHFRDAFTLSKIERYGIATLAPNTLGMMFSIISIPLVIELFGTTKLASLLLILAFSSFGTLYCLGVDKLILRKLCSPTKKRAREFHILLILAFGNFFCLSGLLSVLAILAFDIEFIYVSLGVEPHIFFTLCFANLLLTIGRASIWGNGNLFKLASLNTGFNSAPGVAATFLWAFGLEVTFVQFLYIFSIGRLLIGLVTFSGFIRAVTKFDYHTQISSHLKLVKLFWYKSLNLFTLSLISIASDNFERVIVTVINPTWRDIFVTLQALITKINLIPLSFNVPLFLQNERFKSAVMCASMSYFSLSLGALLIIDTIKEPIETYLLRETIELLPIEHILTFGLAATFSVQNYLFAVALEKRGSLSKVLIPESIILVALCVFSFAFYDPMTKIHHILGIYLIKELCIFLVRISALRLGVLNILRANGFNLIALTLMLALFYFNSANSHLYGMFLFFNAILAIACFTKGIQAMRKIG